MDSLKKTLEQVQQGLNDLENLYKDGKNRNDAMVKDREDKICEALDVPKESWIPAGQALKDLIENIHRQMEILHSPSLAPKTISDDEVLKNASGGLALEGVYKTLNVEDMLAKREQLIEVPQSFSLNGPKQSSTYEQKEFLSHKSQTDYQKAMEKLGFSFSHSWKFGFESFGLGVTTEMDKRKETEEMTTRSCEQSSIFNTKYNYIPLASCFFEKDKLKLSYAAIKALQEIEALLLCSNGKELTSRVSKFYERFGSHANQGPVHFGGIFWWTASAEGFRSHEMSEMRWLTSEALNCHVGAGYSGPDFSISAGLSTSSSEVKGSSTGKNNETLRNAVQLSVGKTGGPAETDNHLQWKSQLVTSNTTWSVVDKGTTLIPVWEIIMSAHKGEFDDPLKLCTTLINIYTEITEINVEKMLGEVVFLEEETAKALIRSVENWNASESETRLRELLEFKTRLHEKTGSYNIWNDVCLSSQALQDYLLEVVKVNKNSSSVHLRILTRSLLDPYLYTVKNFRNRTEIMNWVNLTEEDMCKEISVSEFSELATILQHAKEQLEDRPAFSPAEVEHRSKIKATCTVTHSLNSFCQTLRQTDQEEAELLILSILGVLGYSRKSKTFNHILNLNEIVFLQEKLQTAYSRYSFLKEQCNTRAQAFLLLTALTASTDQDEVISAQERGERLQFIKSELQDKLLRAVKSAIEESLPDWQMLQSKLDCLIIGSQMDDRNTQSDEKSKQLQSLLANQVLSLSELQQTDQENILLNNSSDEKTCSFMNLLQKLGLSNYYPQKMTKADVLLIDSLSLTGKQPKEEKELSSHYLYKLMMLDYSARYLFVKPEAIILDSKDDGAVVDGSDDFFNFDEMSILEESSKQVQIHPMDVHMAIFHCANDFLRQYIFSKLSACQFGLPFLVPNPFTGEVEFPVWAFQNISKSWQSKKPSTSESLGKYKNKQMLNTKVPVVSFIRLGASSNSKSQILNSVLSRQRHSVFFHRHCKGSTPDSLLMNGVVEISWYCPGGKEDDIFDDCMAFLNLHGDAAEHPKQLEFLQAVSTVNVLLHPEHPLDGVAKQISQKMANSSVPFICLFSGQETVQPSNNPKKVRLAAKNRNEAQLTDELISSIKKCIGAYERTASIETCCKVARKQQFKVDANRQLCQDGHAQAQTLMCLLNEENLSTLKERLLPLQGELWHDWGRKNKEQFRLQCKADESIEHQLSVISSEMETIRQRQLDSAIPPNEFLSSFLQCLTSPRHSQDTILFMLQWLRILLDELTTDVISGLESDYHSTWAQMRCIPKNKDKVPDIEQLRKKLNSISDKMAASTVGLQHLMREVSQLYEAIQMAPKAKENIVKANTLPAIGAEMLVSGYPLELMDGDAAHVPSVWIEAVLDELIRKLGDKKVFVLSILGLQSSGKSTLLNTMFGLQFTVSAGRCTRGAFMQLLKVDLNIVDELGYDFVLIVDTEGLRSPELSNNSSLSHDNELATFIIGIGDITVINIMGENPSEIHDILQICVQAFLRMQQVQITPSCIFVHQNVAEASAGDKNKEGRRRLLEKLDDMARIAAEEENVDGISGFSDVIKFDVESQVFYFKNLLEGDPPMAPPNPSYSQNVQELKTKLLTVAEWQTDFKCSPLSKFKSRVIDLWNALLHENFVFSFRNTVEMMVYSSLEEKYSAWSWELRKHALKMQNKLHNQICSNIIQDVSQVDLTENFDEVYNPLKDEIEKYFREDKNKETLIKWRVSIDKRFESLKWELIEGTVIKCKELIMSKKNRSDLDQKKSVYEAQLLKKSKALASILKGQHLTDKEVEEKFDKLWVEWTAEVAEAQPPEKHMNVKAAVEAVLLKKFRKQPNIIQKIKGENEKFQFDKTKHITQSMWQKFISLGRGNVEHYAGEIKHLVTGTVNAYIIGKENAKNDFDENFIYEILSRIEENVEKPEHPAGNLKFTNEFKVDLSVNLCFRYLFRFQKMHETFKTENNPLTYLQSQRDKYLQTFKNYCKGACSVTIFVDFLCEHISPEVQKSVANTTSRLIADEMKSSNPAFNSNRSNLENHILKHLAAQENFSLYEEYIDYPEHFFERFIKEQIDTFCNDTRKMDKMHLENLETLKNVILSASATVTEEVGERKGNASMWLDRFCEEVGEHIVIYRDELKSIENEDIRDLEFLKDRIALSLTEMVKNEKKMDFVVFKKKVTEILFDQLKGCWAQCPFCKAICTNTLPNHDGDHSVQFHRCLALGSCYVVNTDNFDIDFCTAAVNSNKKFFSHVKNERIPFNSYKNGGDPYNKWNIVADGSQQCYWKWFICKFQTRWEGKCGKSFVGYGEIPKQWRTFTKESVLAELK